LARLPNSDLSCETPYRLREPVFQQAFTRRLLADVRRGRVQLYSDTAFARPVAGRQLERELYFLKDWLRNKPRPQAMQLPDYQTEILARELWFFKGDSLLGFDRLFVRIDLFDATKPELPPLTYYLKPEAIEPLLGSLLLSVDFRGNRSFDGLTLWRSHSLGFDVVPNSEILSVEGGPTNRPAPVSLSSSTLTAWWMDYAAKHSTSPQHLAYPVQLVIPTGWHELSYKAGWSPEEPQRLERSLHLVRVLAPQLLRLALTKQIAVYTSMGQRDVDAYNRMVGLIEANLPGPSPRDRRNARSLDYSARVFDLEVNGRWVFDATGGRYEPEWLSLVWGQRIDDPNKEVVATFRVADLRRKGVRVDGQPLDAALADWRAYYAYLFALNDSYIQSLQQAAVVDACLRAGHLSRLAALPHWKTMTNEALQAQMDACRRMIR
jgi:hypothetical protein